MDSVLGWIMAAIALGLAVAALTRKVSSSGGSGAKSGCSLLVTTGESTLSTDSINGCVYYNSDDQYNVFVPEMPSGSTMTIYADAPLNIVDFGSTTTWSIDDTPYVANLSQQGSTLRMFQFNYVPPDV